MSILQDAATCFVSRLLKLIGLFAAYLPLLISSAVIAADEASYSSVGSSQFSSPYARAFNQVLLAELYLKMGDPAAAIQHYSLLINSLRLDSELDSDELPQLAKRATVLATRATHFRQAVRLAKQWVKLKPKDLEARQYLALLLLRMNKIDESSSQLKMIYTLVEQDKNPQGSLSPLYSEGLKFIGAMLLVESQHEKALNLFNKFLQKHNKNIKGLKRYQRQQYLIQASLAEKAKKYHSVISYVNQYEENSLKKERLNDIILMKVKALQAIDRQQEAVSYLSDTLRDYKDASDSLRLELVRLLILNKQRAKARPHLQKLVTKYPDNNDLLKSLIALDIDQGQLGQARNNIAKLRAAKEYHSDADYFMAEVLEAEGKLKLALVKYKAVKTGGLLKNAKRKISRLSRQLKGQYKNKQRVNYKNLPVTANE